MSKYVVIDLEMCKVSRGMKKVYGKSSETIQIGAVLLDESYDIVDSFKTFVNPQYGKIDSFIHNLTGISEKDVCNAPKMPDAMAEFLAWVPDGDVKIVSWSMNDERQLSHERKAFGINSDKLDNLLTNWIDSQEMFDRIMDFDHACALEEALIATDIITEGHAHDALTDAFNTALLFAKMQTEPVLQLNSDYQKAREASIECFSCSFGEIMAAFGISAAL